VSRSTATLSTPYLLTETVGKFSAGFRSTIRQIECEEQHIGKSKTKRFNTADRLSFDDENVNLGRINCHPELRTQISLPFSISRYQNRYYSTRINKKLSVWK
jgi:phosphopentomutase